MKTKSTTKHLNNPSQTELFGLIWRPFKYSFRLRTGDVIRYADRLCQANVP